MKSTFYDRVFQ